jgi:peroxiredoxin
VGYNNGVGRQAPAFTLPASDGGEIELKTWRGDWYPVLLFVPVQAPGVEELLAQLSVAASTFWGLRGQLVALCDASQSEVQELAARVAGLAFPLLADDGRVAAAYGALRQSGEVRPMAVIVDRAGKIVWEADRPEMLHPDTLLAAFREVVR